MRTLSYIEIESAATMLARRWRDADVKAVFGVPRGGCVPAAMVAAQLGVSLADEPAMGVLVVDDLVDSGATSARFGFGAFDALYRKAGAPPRVAPDAVEVGDEWVVFPWETVDESSGPGDAVVRLLEFMGEDPTRDGLRDTPGRVLRAFTEMTAGMNEDPSVLLAKTFEDTCDEMVVVRGIEFVSTCEHHLMPFTGTATVAYVPAGRVVGLSKLARLVECYARRLQVQERMTNQIVQAMDEHLQPLGAAAIVTARHSCMGCRGVRKPGAEMVTSALSGVMRTKPEARAELLALAR